MLVSIGNKRTKLEKQKQRGNVIEVEAPAFHQLVAYFRRGQTTSPSFLQGGVSLRTNHMVCRAFVQLVV